MSEYSREKIYSCFEEVRKQPLEQMFFTGRRKNGNVLEGYPAARCFFCLAGEVHLRCPLNNGPYTDLYLQPGQALFASPYNMIEEMWDRPQEMFAVILPEDIVRMIYIKHDGVSAPPSPAPNPTCFYHICNSLNLVGQNVISSLNYLADGAAPGRQAEESVYLLKALLGNIQKEFRREEQNGTRKHHFLWGEIYEYILNNLNNPLLTRESISRRYHIHVTNVTKIFQQEMGISFSEYITGKRLELAVKLLRQPELQINEIAAACGYSYTSYFIRAFRNRYHKSPGEFRENLS